MDAGDNAAEEAAVAAMDYLELSTGTNIGKSIVDLGGFQAKTDVEKGKLETLISVYIILCIFL